MKKLTIVIALIGLVTAGCSSEPEELAGYVRTPLPSVADVSLPDASNGGQPFTMTAPSGELLLVYFGYTACPDVCPTTLADVRVAMAELGDDADRVTVAMETIDIERDTEEVISKYVESFVAGAHGLRATDDVTLRAAADAFGADYSVETNEEGIVEVGHTAQLYAVDDQGLIQVTWPFGTSAQTIVNDIRILLREQ